MKDSQTWDNVGRERIGGDLFRTAAFIRSIGKMDRKECDGRVGEEWESLSSGTFIEGIVDASGGMVERL